MGMSIDGRNVSQSALSPPFFSDNGERLLIKQGRGDTLYNYSAGKLQPVYLISLGVHTPPVEVFGLNPAGKWDERYYTILNMMESERWMIAGATNRMESENGGIQATTQLVFDRKNGYSGFSATGQGGEQGLFIDGVKFTPCYIRDNRLVGYLQALDMADNAGQLTNPGLKALAAEIKEDGNPVIVVAELKL